jgi:Domain of unknown function (DUF4411)
MPRLKRYCLDTSAISKPLEDMPESMSFYKNIWSLVRESIESGIFAVTKEIYDELCKITSGETCNCCIHNRDKLLMEVDQMDWDAKEYLMNVDSMIQRHISVISEYNSNRKQTIGLNDLSIVALAKTLKLPVISMESDSYQPSQKKVRIPALCMLESVTHLTFNDFLRIEGGAI